MITSVQTQIETLRANLGNLSAKDRDFASSLLHSVCTQRRDASEKQVYWIGRLCERATGSEPQLQRRTAEIGDMANVISMFERIGKTRLRRPAIVLHVANYGDIRLNVAGSTAQVPGSINVVGVDAGTWFGRITRAGTFEQSFRQSTAFAVIDTLRRFSADPLKTAAEHGALVGRCCFCNRRLTDPKSTALGYGPVCAKAWVGA